MQNNEWMKNLKEGEEIAVSRYGNYGARMTLSSIEKITPTGRIVLINGQKFNNEGREMGDHYHHSYLATIDEYKAWKIKEEKEQNRNKLISEVRNMRAEYLTDDQLARIMSIVNEKNE